METSAETKLHTTKAMQVMQAFLDGQQIQCCRCGETRSWDTVTYPTWNWDGFEYRVVPLSDKTFEESVRAHLKAVIENSPSSTPQVCGCGRRAMKDLYRKLFNEEP